MRSIDPQREHTLLSSDERLAREGARSREQLSTTFVVEDLMLGDATLQLRWGAKIESEPRPGESHFYREEKFTNENPFLVPCDDERCNTETE